MLFRRIAFIGVMLAAVSAGVIQVRLMNAAASREIHLLVAQQQNLQRTIWQQEMELARLRTPQRIADRLTTVGAEIVPPGTRQHSSSPAGAIDAGASGGTAAHATTGPAATSPVPTRLAAQRSRAGGPTPQWPSHRSNPRRSSR